MDNLNDIKASPDAWLKNLSDDELIDVFKKSSPVYNPPSIVSGLGKDAKGYYQSLHEPTEPAMSVKDFTTRVLPESLGKTTVGMVEYPYHLAKSFTDPLLTKKPLSGMEDALLSNAEVIARGVGEPLGMYGLKTLKEKWLSDPVGSLLGVMPLVSHLKLKRVKPILEEHVKTGKPLSEIIDIPQKAIDKSMSRKSTEELIKIVEQTKPKPVEVEQGIGDFSPVLSNTKKGFKPTEGISEGVKPFKDVMSEQGIGEYSPVLSNVQKEFEPQSKTVEGAKPFKDAMFESTLLTPEEQLQRKDAVNEDVIGKNIPSQSTVDKPISEMTPQEQLAFKAENIRRYMLGEALLPDVTPTKTDVINKPIEPIQSKGVMQVEGQGQTETRQVVAQPEARVSPEEQQVATTATKPEASPAMAATLPVTTEQPIIKPVSFVAVKDAQSWIKQKSGEYGGRNQFLASKEYETAYPEIKRVFDELSKQNIVQEIKTQVTSQIKIDQSLKDHFPAEEYNTLLKAAPNLFSKKSGISFDEVADGLGITTDELAAKMKDFKNKQGKLEFAKQMIEDYKSSQAVSQLVTVADLGLEVGTEFKIQGEKYKVISRDENGDFVIKDGVEYVVDEFDKIPQPDEGSIKQIATKKGRAKQSKFEYDKTKVDVRPKMESSLTVPALQKGQKGFFEKAGITPTGEKKIAQVAKGANELFIRKATSKEKNIIKDRKEALNNIPEKEGYRIGYKPYGEQGKGFYYIKEKESLKEIFKDAETGVAKNNINKLDEKTKTNPQKEAIQKATTETVLTQYNITNERTRNKYDKLTQDEKELVVYEVERKVAFGYENEKIRQGIIKEIGRWYSGYLLRSEEVGKTLQKVRNAIKSNNPDLVTMGELEIYADANRIPTRSWDGIVGFEEKQREAQKLDNLFKGLIQEE